MIRAFFITYILFLNACVQSPDAPTLTTNAIIEVYNKEGDLNGLVLIDHNQYPWGKTLPGGKIEYGEKVETAIRRLVKEQVNMELADIKQFHVYSYPIRDPNYHAIEITVLARGIGTPRSSRNALNAAIVPLNDIPWGKFVQDKERILRDYFDYQKGKTTKVIWVPTI